MSVLMSERKGEATRNGLLSLSANPSAPSPLSRQLLLLFKSYESFVSIGQPTHHSVCAYVYLS